MFEILALLFSWLPPPLDAIAFGVVCLALLLAVIGIIAGIIDMLPFT